MISRHSRNLYIYRLLANRSIFTFGDYRFSSRSKDNTKVGFLFNCVFLIVITRSREALSYYQRNAIRFDDDSCRSYVAIRSVSKGIEC